MMKSHKVNKSLKVYKVIFTLYLLNFLLYTPLNAQTKELKNEDIFTNMFTAIRNVKTLRGTITSAERIGDNINRTRFSIKVNFSPYKAYTKDLDKGVEVLFAVGQNDNQATVNPNGFPYVNLHLDPLGKVMRKDQHQTIGRLGFNYISSILSHSLAKFPDAYTKNVKRDADTTWEGYACYKIELNFPAYTNNKYTVKEKGETVAKLAATYSLSEYQILTLNNISWYDTELDVGQEILLPSAYAKSTVLFIRKDNNLPVVVRIADDKGFFESYCYTNLQVNSTISDAEFQEDYSDYHF